MSNEEVKDFIFSTLEKILKIDRKHIESIDLGVDIFIKSIKNDENFIQSLIEMQKIEIKNSIETYYKAQSVGEVIKNSYKEREYLNIDVTFSGLNLIVNNKEFEVSSDYILENTPNNLLEDLEDTMNFLKIKGNLDKNNQSEFEQTKDVIKKGVESLNETLLLTLETLKYKIKEIRKEVTSELKIVIDDYCENNNLNEDEIKEIKTQTKLSLTEKEMNLKDVDNLLVTLQLKTKTKLVSTTEFSITSDKNNNIFLIDDNKVKKDLVREVVKILVDSTKSFYTHELNFKKEDKEDIVLKQQQQQQKLEEVLKQQQKLKEYQNTLQVVSETINELWKIELIKNIEKLKNLTIKQKLCLLINLPKKINLNFNSVLLLFEDNPDIEKEDFEVIVLEEITSKIKKETTNILSNIEDLTKTAKSDKTFNLKSSEVSENWVYHESNSRNPNLWTKQPFSLLNINLLGVVDLLIPVTEKTINSFKGEIKEEFKTISDLIFYNKGISKSRINLLDHSDKNIIAYWYSGGNSQLDKYLKTPKGKWVKGFLENGNCYEFTEMSFSNEFNMPKAVEILRKEYKDILIELDKDKRTIRNDRKKETILLNEKLFSRIFNKLYNSNEIEIEETLKKKEKSLKQQI